MIASLPRRSSAGLWLSPVPVFDAEDAAIFFASAHPVERRDDRPARG
jgi:hypothetical protein